MAIELANAHVLAFSCTASELMQCGCQRNKIILLTLTCFGLNETRMNKQLLGLAATPIHYRCSTEFLLLFCRSWTFLIISLIFLWMIMRVKKVLIIFQNRHIHNNVFKWCFSFRTKKKIWWILLLQLNISQSERTKY